MHLPQLCLSILLLVDMQLCLVCSYDDQAVLNTLGHIISWTCIFHFSWENSGRRCLGLRASIYFTLLEMAQLFSKVMVPFCIVTCNISESHLLHLLAHIWQCQSIHLKLSLWAWSVYFMAVLICNFSEIVNVVHLSTYCACWPFVCFPL